MSFVDIVLGESNAKILRRLAEIEPFVGTVLVPRTVLGWIASQTSYRGEIPGIAKSEIILSRDKSRFTGSIRWGQDSIEFQDAELERVGALALIAMGTEVSDLRIESAHLTKLGKTIDAILKTQAQIQSQNTSGAKARAAGPVKPIGPETDPTPEDLKLPSDTPPRIPGIRIKASQASANCPSCGQAQISKSEFTGCCCLRDLAKSTATVVRGDDIYIRFGASWDQSAIDILEETYV
jgi:hypothetical protein